MHLLKCLPVPVSFKDFAPSSGDAKNFFHFHLKGYMRVDLPKRVAMFLGFSILASHRCSIHLVENIHVMCEVPEGKSEFSYNTEPCLRYSIVNSKISPIICHKKDSIQAN